MLEINFDISNNEIYKMEAIWDNDIYIIKTENYILCFYYLKVWKWYLEENTILKFLSVV